MCRRARKGTVLPGKGTEIAREASDLILTDDRLDKVTEAIRQGRKIYSNLKKAIRYIISIHVPIILTASLPLLLGWRRCLPELSLELLHRGVELGLEGLEFFGTIGLDPAIRKGGDTGHPVALAGSETASGRLFTDLAQRIVKSAALAAAKTGPGIEVN